MTQRRAFGVARSRRGAACVGRPLIPARLSPHHQNRLGARRTRQGDRAWRLISRGRGLLSWHSPAWQLLWLRARCFNGLSDYDSYGWSPTSAISYLCKHFTQIWWKSKLLNLFLRNFAECCGLFAEFCGMLLIVCGILRIVC